MNEALLRRQLAEDFAPGWWNMKGWKMQLFEGTLDEVKIVGPAATVTVSQKPRPAPFWKVAWWMDVFTIGETSGWAWFAEQQLKAAFGLIDHCDSYDPRASTALQEELNAQVTCAAKFVRTGRFLTLPNVTALSLKKAGMPDYNVSICLDDAMRQAVEQLIQRLPSTN